MLAGNDGNVRPGGEIIVEELLDIGVPFGIGRGWRSRIRRLIDSGLWLATSPKRRYDGEQDEKNVFHTRITQQMSVRLRQSYTTPLNLTVQGEVTKMICMLNTIEYSLPADIDAAVKAELESWRSDKKISRIWAKDASVWTGDDESKWLGWLDIVDEELSDLQKYRDLAADIEAAGFANGYGRLLAVPRGACNDIW
jgi:hypothetical protein